MGVNRRRNWAFQVSGTSLKDRVGWVGTAAPRSLPQRTIQAWCILGYERRTCRQKCCKPIHLMQIEILDTAGSG